MNHAEPSVLFTDEQQTRLRELMEQFRTARDVDQSFEATWESTQTLLGAGNAIERVAQSLPYVMGY